MLHLQLYNLVLLQAPANSIRGQFSSWFLLHQDLQPPVFHVWVVAGLVHSLLSQPLNIFAWPWMRVKLRFSLQYSQLFASVSYMLGSRLSLNISLWTLWCLGGLLPLHVYSPMVTFTPLLVVLLAWYCLPLHLASSFLPLTQTLLLSLFQMLLLLLRSRVVSTCTYKCASLMKHSFKVPFNIVKVGPG